MNAHESITERSLYPLILNLAKHISSKVGIKVTGVSEVKVSDKYPDILLQLDSYKLLVQVKIDSLQKMLDDLAKTYPIATKYDAGLLLLLLPPEVKRIHPEELENTAPLLRVKRAIMLASWISKHVEEATLENILRTVIEALKEYKEVLKPSVDYLTIAYIAREAVEELASILRTHILITPKLLDQAQAIVGRFDFYKALLSEAIEKEEVMKTYIADIIAYLTILYLLFIHIASIKKYGYTILPQIKNPLQPPQNLLDNIVNSIKGSRLIKDYCFIVEPSIYILELLKNVEEIISFVLARYIYVIQALRPEHVKEELFGRIYQESIPPETRKNLGAFFTNPVAARILAYLAIEKWDDKVLDPACGSGTLLAYAYEAKMENALAQGIDRQKAHELFIRDHIVGIDIMQFAKNLTSVNLTLQEVKIPIEPAILWGDGIEKMISTIKVEVNDAQQQASIYDYIVKRDQEKYSRYLLPREGFDVIIMNPPFTRRERTPKGERERLEKILGKIVRGKVGYWAYFFAAADNVIKLGGKLAAVTPEEFFVGSSAESVRRHLLKGEVSKDGKWVKVLPRRYIPQVIIKSAVEVAFSEGARYRDYLVVLRKVPEDEIGIYNKCIIVTLKKKLEEIKGKEKDIAMQIKSLLKTPSSTSVSNDVYDAVVLDDIDVFINRYIKNLKPLIFFNSMKTLELFYQIVTVPGLKRLDEIANLRDYTCQYTGKGFEEYCRRLFISRYETRAAELSFEYVSEDANAVKVKIVKSNITFNLPKNATVYSLRTYAGVKHMDVTGEEENAIIEPQIINEKYLISAGLVDKASLYKASKDIKEAYEAIAGKILLVRRARITSNNLYWLAFYSSNKIIGPSSPMICLKLKREETDHYKALTLYLNSSLAFLQLLAYLAMAEGGWITLHNDQTWSNVLVPDLESLSKDILNEAVQTFNEVAKCEEGLTSLYSRYSSGSELQKKIDRMALKMIGLKWPDERLDELYKVIKLELDIMQRILEESSKAKKKTSMRKREEGRESSKQASLSKWIEQ
jgi:tRNA1(Val) A37 N6-methylase TrmN6